MPQTEVTFKCEHTVTRNLPKQDFEPNAEGLTFLQRAALLDCKVCRGKAKKVRDAAAAKKAAAADKAAKKRPSSQ